MTSLESVPMLRGTDPGTGRAVPRRTRGGIGLSDWVPSRRTLLQAGTALGMAALSVFPAARRAYADGYTILGSCPSYANDHNCSPGCGPSTIFADACATSGTFLGFHKNDGVTWTLRPNQCYASSYDGWLWQYQGACGACACSVQRRCHDGYRKVGSSWVKSICRWNTQCECLTSISWPATRRGSSGTNVYTVQHLLTARGFPVTVDGIFGAGTETSVGQFQTANGLSASGVVDAQTWPVLVITLRMPDNGQAVRGAQRQLNKYGYALTVDGAFGALTDAAVRDFQRQNALTVDGVVGQNTWRTLTGGAV